MYKGPNIDKVQHIYDEVLHLSSPIQYSTVKGYKINHTLYPNMGKKYF